MWLFIPRNVSAFSIAVSTQRPLLIADPHANRTAANPALLNTSIDLFHETAHYRKSLLLSLLLIINALSLPKMFFGSIVPFTWSDRFLKCYFDALFLYFPVALKRHLTDKSVSFETRLRRIAWEYYLIHFHHLSFCHIRYSSVYIYPLLSLQEISRSVDFIRNWN